VVHLVFILFVLGGALLSLYFRRAAYLHLAAVAWGSFVEFFGKTCPLTPVEVRLRTLAGEQGYATSFIDHYLLPILYPSGLTPRLQWAFGAVVLLLNGLLYTLISFKANPRR